MANYYFDMRKSLIIYLGLCLVSAIICLSTSAYAQEVQALSTKKITGEVSFADKKFLSIIYKKEESNNKEYEMVFYIDKNAVIKNVKEKNLRGLGEQDIVQIEYVEIQKGQTLKRVARKIEFLRKASPLSLDVKGLKR